MKGTAIAGEVLRNFASSGLDDDEGGARWEEKSGKKAVNLENASSKASQSRHW